MAEPVTINVDVNGAQVMLVLNRPVQWFALDAEAARTIARAMLAAADSIAPLNKAAG